MKRFLPIMLAVSVVAQMLLGCSGNSGASEELTAVEVGRYIQQAASLDDMKQGDWEKLQKLFHIEAEKVEDFVLYTASSNVKADELAVIKAKDANEVDTLIENIQKRIDAQSVKFQGYRPEEYYLIERHVLKTKGRFILFAVSEEADRMEEVFDEALK
ncbi:DUF4358 domain-containing protein [Xylanibacillus composti]|uniref:DUF4358 domain-containing protein n=1 Tax=Xylanibacillus composti TaxID=1572762 RepID=A0A8J4H7I8_9BACL|nr:DUF4358 domain-containing protein [Xylanibacillus composti]MDT9727170.1 DUF4358 domain-containing protein [Xylanibacillus composti]GIQ70404.1 hypothetical protein XYCOK13_32280 [Xylanibacillus composti]